MRLYHDPVLLKYVDGSPSRLRIRMHLIGLGNEGLPKLRQDFRRYGVGQLVRTGPGRAPYLHGRGRREATLLGAESRE